MDSLADDIADQLSKYTACDISDALLKLQSPGAGFLANLKPYTLNLRHPVKITIAPVSTVLFAPKGVDLLEPANNIPEGKHWADLTKPGTIVVMKQPEGQSNAIFGGIMALRMTACEAHGIIVAGRVRDLAELRGTSIPVCETIPITLELGSSELEVHYHTCDQAKHAVDLGVCLIHRWKRWR